ncbi:MAG: hypothetical protein D6738_00730 [Acidobacteria bacterium]|nr:MAG: hypothetical protein D6738_00730 [Acidobacteriota bacterium]
MSAGLQLVLVGVAVIAAAAFLARRAWRALRGRSGCGACPAVQGSAPRMPTVRRMPADGPAARPR